MTTNRKTPIEINKAEFREIGYQLIDAISEFVDTIEEREVTPGESPNEVRAILGDAELPDIGAPASELMKRATDLLIDHSLFNGHPKFLGYITSSPAPIGILADLLASNINPNVGANILSPMATAIENQTIRWLCEFIGVPDSYGGIMVSGGNMANLTAFLAARTAKAPKELKEKGLAHLPKEMIVYCSASTHTWIEKAAVLFGHGTKAVRWIPTDMHNQMNNEALEQAVIDDKKDGKLPFLVIGTAGDVSTGVVDDLSGIAAVCNRHNLWFHIDGAYGIPAAAVPELGDLFKGIKEADSIAMDPHKWLYSPLEAGCTLVKDPQHLLDTYSSHPVYYNFDNYDEEPPTNYYERGFQNSRGFRALKVWMSLQHVGKNGYIDLIRQDIDVSEHLFKLAEANPELEAVTHNLSIATMRYLPSEANHDKQIDESYLNRLNEKLLNDLQKGGEVFLSNAMVNDKYCLRGCIVNFRTSKKDAEEIIDIVVREGRKMHREIQEGHNRTGK